MVRPSTHPGILLSLLIPLVTGFLNYSFPALDYNFFNLIPGLQKPFISAPAPPPAPPVPSPNLSVHTQASNNSITIHPAPHGANAFHSYYPAISSARELLSRSCPKEDRKVRNDFIIQSSFEDITASNNVYGTSNGFVDTVVKAYNEHLHLEIRADDVWLTILAQFSIFVNEHAEELRETFVSHKGQEFLELMGDDPDLGGKPTTMWGVDWGKFSYKMTSLIAAKIKDPSLREWILPSFSTTTEVDETVAAVLMMATFQKYFSYGCTIICGLPSVTLLGQKEDWVALAAKAERLETFGEETKMWYALLKPVLEGYVRSFDEPEAPETKDFWQKVVHYSGGGSGPTYLSGWITAFCFWGSDGKPLYQAGSNPGSGDWYETDVLQLDDARYHRIETTDIPPSWASVPVKLNDNGWITWTNMVAGSVGMRARSSGQDLHNRPGENGLDTLSVESGWWMYEKKSDKEMEEAKEARRKAHKEKYGNDYYDDDI